MAYENELIKYIVEHADKDFIWHYIMDVVELDWVACLREEREEALLTYARQLGYSNKGEQKCLPAG